MGRRPPAPRPPDIWAGGDEYERYMGRWGRPVARAFIGWLGVPANARWLDIGCGTGALTAAILELAAPASVLGFDPSAAYVAHAGRMVPDPRARFEVGDAVGIPAVDGSFDAVVSGLVLNFVTDVGAALAEWRRITRSGGTVGAYVWDYAGEMQLLRRFWEAAVALEPTAAALDEGVRFPLARPDALAHAFEAAGLAVVRTRAIDVPTHFPDFDDLWRPFLGGQGPGPAYVASLPERGRGALRDRLRASVPASADGSIDLMARAWAVRARRP